MSGADFTDAIKEQARRLAFFRCCYCHLRPGDDVHHLTPKEDGGLGTLDNAILLCVQCHADYGHRPEKRTQLRQARNHWYEVVEKQFAPVAVPKVEEFVNAVRDAVRSDVREVVSKELRSLTEMIIGRFESGSTSTDEVVNIGSSMITSLTAPRLIESVRVDDHAKVIISGPIIKKTEST